MAARFVIANHVLMQGLGRGQRLAVDGLDTQRPWHQASIGRFTEPFVTVCWKMSGTGKAFIPGKLPSPVDKTAFLRRASSFQERR